MTGWKPKLIKCQIGRVFIFQRVCYLEDGTEPLDMSYLINVNGNSAKSWLIMLIKSANVR